LSAFGDVAMTAPVISVLRSTHPEIKITLLTTRFFSTLYNQIPEINFLYFEPKHKTLRGLFGLSRKINKINPDFIIDLHNVLRTKILRLFLINKFGNTSVVNKGRKEKKLLIRGIKSEPLKSMHRRYAETFEALNIKINIDDFSYYKKIKITNHNYAFSSNDKLIGIAPFARHQCKEYSMNNIINFINSLDKSWQILIFGAPGNEEQKIIKLCNNKSNRHVISSNYNLEQQMAIMSNLDVMISMDSANGHIASLFGIDVITIWGATHPNSGYGPLNQPKENSIIPDLNKFPNLPVTIYGSNCPTNYLEVINSIKVERILKRLNQII
jgi:ADP-heptose:LPS heptosyltransferase